jgi:DNA polymerase (family 10)
VKQAVENHNKNLAAIFRQMAACYRYLGAEERFRTIAYENAARTMDGLKEDVSVYADNVKHLDQLKGIGESIAEKIIEYLQTGKINTFEKLQKQVPLEFLDLMEVNGMGPSTLKVLHEKLGINTRDELVLAIEKGKLSTLKGFGEKKIDNIKRALKLYKESGTRILLWDAMLAGEAILNEVKKIKGVIRAELAGSLRRRKETIGDIDIIIACGLKSRKQIIKIFTSLAQVDRTIAAGDTKASVVLKENNIQVDIRLVDESEYGSALLYFTGSKEHNIHLRLMAKDKGWKISEYGLFHAKTNKRLGGETENQIYDALGIHFIPPELREDKGEIEQAQKHTLPNLVESKDIKGDMQMHSTWSDGAESIEHIAKHILKNFPRYQYIVITDHSPSERIAHGLQPDEFKKQFAEIDKVNKSLGKDFVKKGVEVDILSDGSLDLPDLLLKEFEWVTASIHSGFNKDNTSRLLKACEHPYVHCIGHPSGRLIGKREGYIVDWQKLFKKASSTGTAIEINAQPERLDLKDDLVHEAIKSGVMITISTDAHNLNQFEFMQLGVDAARRGWCEKDNILNTQSWKGIMKFASKK